MSERVTFKSKGGGDVAGALAIPAGSGQVPGVVVLQEWWGLTDHIKGIADRLAEERFVALAPDLYHGKLTKDPDEAGKLMDGARLGRRDAGHRRRGRGASRATPGSTARSA